MAGLLLSGCEKDTSSQFSQNDSGMLKISLTDSPADLQAVLIQFSEVSAKVDSNWVLLSDSSQTVDLLEWQNGRSLVIAEGEVPGGRYNQIRLKIDSAKVVRDNVFYPAEVPSGARSGLKLNTHFNIQEGLVLELVVDFDAGRSVVRLGPPHNPSGYKIKPVLRVVNRAETGAITGVVTNPENLPVAYALQGSDTVASAIVDNFNGQFILAFLAAGSYSVSIEDTLGLSFRQDNLEVNAGETVDLGPIMLQ